MILKCKMMAKTSQVNDNGNRPKITAKIGRHCVSFTDNGWFNSIIFFQKLGAILQIGVTDRKINLYILLK
jgi:hypothetical protein